MESNDKCTSLRFDLVLFRNEIRLVTPHLWVFLLGTRKTGKISLTYLFFTLICYLKQDKTNSKTRFFSFSFYYFFKQWTDLPWPLPTRKWFTGTLSKVHESITYCLCFFLTFSCSTVIWVSRRNYLTYNVFYRRVVF